MRKLLCLVILLVICFSAAVLATEEEPEISYYWLFHTYSPDYAQSNQTDPVEKTTGPTPVSTPVPETEQLGTEPVYFADGSIQITVTAVGDVTIGRNVQHSGTSIFDKELKKQNNDVNFIFRNVKDIFESDDLTIANFECVLASSYSIPSEKKNNDYLFLSNPSYVEVLTNNSVEAVSIENNHIGDFGTAGKNSTIEILENAGVVWSNADNMGVYHTQGITIGMLSYQTLNQPITSEQLSKIVAEDIAEAKKTCDLVIVSFHWGVELDYSPRDNQIMLGHAAIDAGADLVLGHHSHRVNPIECYKGRYIVYSLANCSFAGNNKPSDMLTFIFQTRFKIKDGEITANTFRIIPCRISSRTDYNDFTITPLTNQTSINTLLSALTDKTNNKNLNYAVESYPFEWE